MIDWIGFAVGLVILGLTWASVVKTFLLPRAAHSQLNQIVSQCIYRSFMFFTRRVGDQVRRERILSVSAPTFLLSLLGTWLACLWIGFGLLLWPPTGKLELAMRESGSSLFTLGFAFPRGFDGTVLVFVAAASGLTVLALLIGYLPLLYAAFNRRETLVTSLEALAGSPPWGPELLARQVLIDNIEVLPDLYGRWTEWAADLGESHVNYRTLVYFRSLDPSGSWLLSLLAVLDGAALHLSLNPSSAPHQARPLMRVGYLTMRRIANAIYLTVPDDPKPTDPIDLTREDFDEAVRWLQEAGWQAERLPDDAWPHYHGWRVNYEAAAYRLAYHLDLPPALWSGPRRPGRIAARPPRRPADRKPDLTN
jgi:hypothetical protein